MRPLGTVPPRRARSTVAAAALVGLVGLTACGASTATTSVAPDTAASSERVFETPTTPTTPATTAPTTTTPTTIATTTTQATLPTPMPAPDPDAPDPAMELGTIEIPKIGVNRALWEGVSLNTLDRGPGHWPGTAMPGELGNVVVGGHRVSHDRPFRNIDQLVPGDEITLTFAGVRHTYLVTGSQVVTPNDVWVIDQTLAHTATLFACHPPGSTKERYVVFATLAGT